MHPFTPVLGPSAWYAEEYRNSNEHVYDLSAQDLAELNAAVAAVSLSGKDIQVTSTLTCPHCSGQALSVSAGFADLLTMHCCAFRM